MMTDAGCGHCSNETRPFVLPKDLAEFELFFYIKCAARKYAIILRNTWNALLAQAAKHQAVHF